MIKIRLKEIANKKGWTQAKIVEETGLSPNTVRGYYYNQIQRPDLDALEKICKAMKVSISQLLVQVDEEPELVGAA